MRCRASRIREARLCTKQATMHVWDSCAPWKDRCTSVTVPTLCSNRATTRVNLLKAREKIQHRKSSICGSFASSRKLQQTIVLPSHGRGRCFETSIAHSGKVLFCRTIWEAIHRQIFRIGRLYTSSTPTCSIVHLLHHVRWLFGEACRRSAAYFRILMRGRVIWLDATYRRQR
jgi:hypothetical protein